MQGGVGDYTHQLALALAALGAEVHVVTRRASAEVRASAFRVHAVVGRWSLGALFQIRALAASLGLDFLNLQYQAAAYDLSAPIHFLPRLIGLGGRRAQLRRWSPFTICASPIFFPRPAPCARPR